MLECALICQPYLIKHNRQERSATVARPLETDGDVRSAMSEGVFGSSKFRQ
jgi:fructose-1-phosphate kinase PfkB-like protein